MGNAYILVIPYFFGTDHVGRVSGQQRLAGVAGTTVGMLLLGTLRQVST